MSAENYLYLVHLADSTINSVDETVFVAASCTDEAISLAAFRDMPVLAVRLADAGSYCGRTSPDFRVEIAAGAKVSLPAGIVDVIAEPNDFGKHLDRIFRAAREVVPASVDAVTLQILELPGLPEFSAAHLTLLEVAVAHAPKWPPVHSNRES